MGNSSFSKDMKRIADNVGKQTNKLSEGITLEEIATPSFMQAHSEFQNINEFFASSGFNTDSQSNFEAIPTEELDAFISQHSDFNSWQDLLTEAGSQYLSKNMKL